MTTHSRSLVRWILSALIMTAVGAAWSTASKDGSATRPPHIVYINADDLGWADLGYQGSEYYETPHIDRLASEGMVFSNAYAPAANCAPSRASCMTGLYTPRHGVYTVGDPARGKAKDRRLTPTPNREILDGEFVTIAESLKAAGYVTGHFGKWHLGADPTTQGFDVNIAGREWGSPSGGGYHSPYSYPNCEQDEPGEYLTDRLGVEAARFIEDNADQPFFLHFATYSVHTPIQGKAELVAKYQNKPTTEAHNDPAYAAMVQSLDENVGRLVRTLAELGLAENTLVVFSSDNGGHWKISKQWPLRAGKGSYYEGGIRVPFLMRWAGRISPGASDVPVSGIDLLPTILEATGAKHPQEGSLDGVSLMPLLTRHGKLEERPLFWHFPSYLQSYVQSGPFETADAKFRSRPGSAVRHGDWKLIENFEYGDLELYNLKEDLSEQENLVKQRPDKAEELHDLLRTWRDSVDAPVPNELNPEYEEAQSAAL